MSSSLLSAHAQTYLPFLQILEADITGSNLDSPTYIQTLEADSHRFKSRPAISCAAVTSDSGPLSGKCEFDKEYTHRALSGLRLSTQLGTRKLKICPLEDTKTVRVPVHLLLAAAPEHRVW